VSRLESFPLLKDGDVLNLETIMAVSLQLLLIVVALPGFAGSTCTVDIGGCDRRMRSCSPALWPARQEDVRELLMSRASGAGKKSLHGCFQTFGWVSLFALRGGSKARERLDEGRHGRIARSAQKQGNCAGGPQKEGSEEVLVDPLEAELGDDCVDEATRQEIMSNVAYPPYPESPGPEVFSGDLLDDALRFDEAGVELDDRDEESWAAAAAAVRAAAPAGVPSDRPWDDFSFTSHSSYRPAPQVASDASQRGRQGDAGKSTRPLSASAGSYSARGFVGGGALFGHASLASTSEYPDSAACNARLWQRELFEAALAGDARTVAERVLDQGVDVNARCQERTVELHHVRWAGLNRSALHFAVLGAHGDHAPDGGRGHRDTVSLY